MTDFSITWDYRCPFARNAHEYVVAGLRAGAPWQVGWAPFSLGQVHVAEGEPDIWDRPTDDSGLVALQAGIVVRDLFPERFLDVHLALFALRHDEAKHLGDPAEVRRVLGEQGVDAEAVFDEIATGSPLKALREEHTAAAEDHKVWGVPTFIADGNAVFVRLMDRPGGDGERARRSVERILDLVVGFPELNEFKHTALDR